MKKSTERMLYKHKLTPTQIYIMIQHERVRKRYKMWKNERQ